MQCCLSALQAVRLSTISMVALGHVRRDEVQFLVERSSQAELTESFGKNTRHTCLGSVCDRF